MLLVSRQFSVPKPLSQIQRSTLWLLQGLSPKSSFGGFGFSYYRAAAYEDPPDWRADAERTLSNPLLFLFGDRRVKTSAAMGAGPLEDIWRKTFPNSRGKHMGNYGHFLQWEAPEAVNRELLVFLGEGAT